MGWGHIYSSGKWKRRWRTLKKLLQKTMLAERTWQRGRGKTQHGPRELMLLAALVLVSIGVFRRRRQQRVVIAP